MERKEFVTYCIDSIKAINAADPKKKEKLYKDFHKELVHQLEGVDYMEFKDGLITNMYVNFDSNCGLSVITASIDISQFLEYKDILEKKDETNLRFACRLMCEIGERDERWVDLIDDGYKFTYDPESTSLLLASIMVDWNGEEDLAEEIKEATL